MSVVSGALGSDADPQALGSAALALLLDQLPGAAICLIDPAGVIEHWHTSAERLLGHVAGQVEGQRLENLFPEERRFEAALARALFEASAQGRASIDAGLMTRSGQRRVCHVDLHPCLESGGDVQGFILLLRAAGPVRSIETTGPNDELMVAHRSNLARAHDEPAWIGVDLSMRVTRVSRPAADWMACDVEDPIGRALADCARPADGLSWAVAMHRVVRAGGASSLDVASVEEGGGPSRKARLVGLHTPDGRLDGFTLVIEPLGAPAAAEVAHEPALADHDALLGAAHDLREPLRKMQRYAQQLQTSEAPRLSDDGRRQLENMQAAAERLQSMVGGMLRLAQVDAGQASGESLDLAEVMQEARTGLAVLIEEHNAEFEIGALGTVVGDRDQLRALFQNLIENSIRYRRHDVAPQIRIAAVAGADERDRVHLRYSDNGRGISDPDRAFRPFQRQVADTDEPSAGSGIGLSLCQRICRRHRGELRITDTDDQGTRFAITLNDLETAH